MLFILFKYNIGKLPMNLSELPIGPPGPAGFKGNFYTTNCDDILFFYLNNVR